MSVSPSPTREHVREWAWFAAWALVGAAAALATVSLGLLVGIPAAAVAAVMASRPTIRHSALGLVFGAGLLLLYVAYVQRQGPGTTCWHRGTASGCDQHLNPIPWLVLGVVFVVAGVMGQAARNRERNER
jgi:hypothetical protein